MTIIQNQLKFVEMPTRLGTLVLPPFFPFATASRIQLRTLEQFPGSGSIDPKPAETDQGRKYPFFIVDFKEDCRHCTLLTSLSLTVIF